MQSKTYIWVEGAEAGDILKVKVLSIDIADKGVTGVIGIATAEEEGEWPTNTPWKHGGNMDTTDIKAGSTLYFQVKQKGALLALGDCHAIMGDGEVSMVGLEIPAQVTLEIDVIKNKSINWPILTNEYETMIVSSGNNVEDAIREAVTDLVEYLKRGLNIEWEEAYMLSSITADIKISQVVNPKKTVRASIPKYLLSAEKLIQSI